MIGGALRLAGEPLRWVIAPADVSAYLQARGFRVLEQASTADLHARFLAPAGLQDEPLASYEHRVLATTVRS